MYKLIKISLTLIMLFTMVVNGLSQNLVPNPSFENYTLCPDGASQLDRLTDWFDPTAGSSDFYNSCFTSGGGNMDVPNNFFGFQSPVTGNGYVGLYMHYYFTLYREYAEVKLTDSLIAGNKYYVSFSVSLADSSNFATDDIGIYFSNDSLLNTSSFDNFSVTPHVESSQGTFLSDKIIWYFITGEYIASGGEKFLTLGNFKDDANTDTISVPNGGSLSNDYFCYYYIDNVCVSSDSMTCVNAVGINHFDNEVTINIFPNPVQDYLNINNIEEHYDLTIFNSLGQVIFMEKNIRNTNKRISTNQFDSGLLFINIKTKNLNLYYKSLKT